MVCRELQVEEAIYRARTHELWERPEETVCILCGQYGLSRMKKLLLGTIGFVYFLARPLVYQEWRRGLSIICKFYRNELHKLSLERTQDMCNQSSNWSLSRNRMHGTL